MGWEMHRKWPVIIAMQGDPYTGKTTLANNLSKRLGYLTISFDDILDTVGGGDESSSSSSSADVIMSHAFDLIIQVVKTQITLGLSVIVDSPLPRRSHIDKLVGLLTESRHRRLPPLSLVLVHCNPKNEYAWRMRFDADTYIERSGRRKWYTLPDLDGSWSRDYTEDYVQPPLVSKLVVDTTSDAHFPPELIAFAVQDLTACPNGHKLEFVNYFTPIHDRIPHVSKRTPPPKEEETMSLFCHDGHCINQYREKADDATIVTHCGVCDSQVANSFYACMNCPLAIHKSCAESKLESTTHDPSKFLERGSKTSYAYSLPDEHRRQCVRCKGDGNSFSYECASCVFESHLKWGSSIPKILHHPMHRHALFLLVSSIVERSSHGHLCDACRCPKGNASYVCSYTDKCRATFHPECLFLPSLLRGHEHGGYTHDLDLNFVREQELEDYVCDKCLDKMDPKAWYYYCKECVLSMHLDCAFQNFDA